MPDSIDTLSTHEKRAMLARLLEQREARPKEYPASFAQQRLWFLDQLAPGNPFYCEAVTLRLPYALDDRVLEMAIREIARRHESLRTVLRDSATGLLQVVLPSADVDFDVVDLRSRPGSERGDEAARLAFDESRRGFDLSKGPLARFRIIRLADDDQIFLITMHHIVCDGWSLSVFVGELSVLYDAFVEGRPSPLEPLPVQYSDFSVWQREQLQGEELKRLVGFWKERLDGVATLRLPTDRPRPPVQTFQGAAHPLTFAEGLCDELKALARQEDATFFMVLLAAYATLLYRYADQDDIAVGCPVANRNRTEIEGLIGFFVNSLVMRMDLSGEPTFRELVRRVRSVALDAYAHQDLPFEKLVEEIAPERDMGRNPLFQVTFQLFVAAVDDGAGGEPVVPQFDVERTTAKFDLRLDVYEYGRQCDGMIEYNTDLFDNETIANMCRHFMRILEQSVANPDGCVSRFDLMDETERTGLQQDGTGRVMDVPAGSRLHNLVERQARRTPEKVAVVSGSGRLTYRDLDAQADALAIRLRRMGVGPDVLVGVAMERCLELVVAFLGVLKAGGAYVPIDATSPPERVQHMLADAAAAVLLTERKWADRWAPPGVRVLSLDGEPEDNVGVDPALDEESTVASPDDIAYVLYTSGTTGVPKGTAIPHRAIVNHMLWMDLEFPLDGSDVVLQRTPIGFDASVWEFYAPLLSGATLVMAPPGLAADVVPIIDTIRHERVTILQVVPSLLRILVADERFAECRTLRRLFVGGEALPVDLVKQLPAGLQPAVINLYGPTEATIDATFHVCTSEESGLTVPIGRPVANTRVYVVDRRGAVVPRGVPGELWIAGACLARGYWRRDELTAARFSVSAWGERVYRTGDRVVWRAGGLEFLGRDDQQVKIRGYRVELAEVEAVITREPEVAACVAEVRPGPAGAELVAYVVPRTDEGPGDVDGGKAWREVFDAVYRGRSGGDPTFEVVGWRASDTDEALDAAEMREWRDETLARLRSLAPERVLEVGCGTGLLLFPLSAGSVEYVGTDFSREALAHVGAHLRQPGVRLEEREASDWTGLPEGHFDLVILNSVVQYFPDEAYLRRVLVAAARAVRSGGFVFVGDVRHLGLQEAYAAWVELRRAAADARAGAIAARVRERLLGEEELLIAPEYFAKIKEVIPELIAWEVQAKLGRTWNELSRFRYDVLLQVGGAASPPIPQQWRTWTGEDARQMAAQSGGWRGVATARLSEPLHLARALRDVPAETPVETMRAVGVSTSRMAEPEAVRAAGAAVQVRYGEQADRFDLLVHHGPAGWRPEAVPGVAARWEELVNTPALGKWRRALVPRLRMRLAARVPEWMVPATWVLLDHLPVTAHGKIDRRALPAPDLTRSGLVSVAPRTAVEVALTKIWRELLGQPRIGVTDNFFHLGGHSLLATQLLSRIRAAFQVPLPLRALFEALTIEAQAALIEQLRAEGPGLEETSVAHLPREQFRRNLQDIKEDW